MKNKQKILESINETDSVKIPIEVVAGKERIIDNYIFVFFTDNEGAQLKQLINILIPQTHENKFIRIAETLDQDFSRINTKNKIYWVKRFYKRGLLKLNNYCPNLSTYEIENILDRENNDFLKIFIQKVMQDSIKIFYSHPDNLKIAEKDKISTHLPFARHNNNEINENSLARAKHPLLEWLRKIMNP